MSDEFEAPPHLGPRTLHTLVFLLWVVVGIFTGLGAISAIGAYQMIDGQRLGVIERCTGLYGD